MFFHTLKKLCDSRTQAGDLNFKKGENLVELSKGKKF